MWAKQNQNEVWAEEVTECGQHGPIAVKDIEDDLDESTKTPTGDQPSVSHTCSSSIWEVGMEDHEFSVLFSYEKV